MKNTTVLCVLAAVVCLAGVFMGGCKRACDGAKTGKAEKPALEARIPLGSTAPVIDGKFDEKEWEKAACVSGFITNGKDWAPEQSSAYLVVCDGILYVAMRCLKATPFELKAQKRQANSMEIFGDESVEIFIMPDPEKDIYYHFTINALGSVYTAQCGGGKRDESWNPKMEAVCEAFTDGWVLEAKIDLAALGAGTRLGDKWKMNFGRNSSSALGRFASSWTGQRDFNVPALFGSCVVSKSGGLGYSLEKINMSAADLVVRNADCEPRECELVIQSELGDVDRKKLTIPPFSATPVRLNTLRGTQAGLEISIDFGESQSLNVKSALVPYECGGMFSVAPSLYYCRSGETISSKVDRRLENIDSIKIAVIGPGQTKPLREIILKSRKKSFSFNTKNMKPGRHVISSVALDAKGKVLWSDEKVFIVVKEGEAAPLPEKKKFDLDGRLIKMNGELFFPFASCSPPKGNNSPLADDSFNVNVGNIGIRTNAASSGSCGYPATFSRVGGTHFEAPEKGKVFECMKTVIAN
ncbi:MAG: carbohydrate-binding family 9-like protein, partial [Kiritimatiellia bacterium]|nr:carbohydrate-binding family 9-like protein [Kiritimatiellia bacterium]